MKSMELFEEWMALHTAKARYCRYLDTKDWQGFASLLTEDFELDLSGTSHLGIINGREAALNVIRSSLENAVTAHQVHTPEIEIDGDQATVIWPMQDRVIWSAEKPSLIGYGHYNERWIKRDGQWRLAAQRLTRLHMEMLPPSPVAAPR